MNQTVLAIGRPSQDIFLTGPALVDDGGRLCLNLGDKLDCQTAAAVGGNAANVAVTLARAGLNPRFVGRTGDDAGGRVIRDQLQAAGVDTANLRLVPNQASHQSVILLTGSGSRVILSDYSPELHPDDWQPALAGLSPDDWIYLSSVGGPKRVMEIIRQAADRGANIALNPSQSGGLRDPAGLLAVAGRLRLLIANREEMAQLWPGQTIDELAIAAAAQVPAVVVTDGPRGSVAAADGQLYRAGLYQPGAPVVDRTGAGDAFAGGLLAGLIKDQPIETCLTWAAANSTAVVGRLGAQTGILELGTEPLAPLAVDRRPIASQPEAD